MSLQLRVLGCLASSIVAACSTTTPARPEITGPYAERLPASEIQQIQFIVSQRSDVHKPVAHIWCEDRDHATVSSGPMYNGATGSFLKLTRKHGKWFITSVQEVERIMIRCE